MLLYSPSKGRLTLGANGSFTYKPKRNFHGTVSFTYGAHDGTAESNAAVVKIRVLSVRG